MGGAVKNILVLLLLFISWEAYCHPDSDYKFRTLSPPGGFYYDGVKSIRQDSGGFIWVVMDNDIQRFDGYTYKSYYPKFKQLLSGVKWSFGDIDTDSGGRLYVATNNGLFLYNSLTDSFDLALEVDCTSVAVDDRDNIWLNIAGRAHRVDSRTMEMDSLSFDGSPVRSIGSFHSEENEVYMGSFYGRILRYDHLGGEMEMFHKLPDQNLITGMASDPNTLWVLTSLDGLYSMDKTTRDITGHFEFPNPGGYRVPARALARDRDGRLWVGTQSGVWVVSPDTGNMKRFEYSQTEMFSIPNNSIWSLTEDSRGNIWIGTFSGGLCVVALDEPETFRTYDPVTSGLTHNMVSSFVQDGQSVWIGTEGGGLNKFDRATGTFTGISSAKSGLTFNNLKSLALDPSGNLWIAMYLAGLDRYDPRTGTFRNYRSGSGDHGTLVSNNLRKIVRDGDHGLWIIYQAARSVLTYYSFADDAFTHYNFDQQDNIYYLFDIVKGRGSDLWIISSRNLYRFDTALGKAENILGESIPYLNAQSLAIDGHGDIWIGTIGHGITRFHPSDGTFDQFEDMPGLNVSAVYSMVADDSDRIWMGTDNGLVMYDPDKGLFTRFDQDDGLQGRVYYPLSALKTSDGTLFFGGTNGFSTVNPRNLWHNQVPPRVIISEFLLDNEPRSGEGYGNGEVVLPYNQTNFGFTFSCDNFIVPLQNSYRYRLHGYDNRWVTTDALNRNVIFTKVPAGTFRFDIQAANNDGVWGEVTSVRITRRAAPWASTWAYILYLLVTLTIASVIIRFYRQRKLLELQLYKDKLAEQQKDEIHQSQLRFFTNISHDFRTPLSLILGAVDNLKGEGLSGNYYRMLHNNARRLLNLVNELMDFRTLQNGKMQLQVAPLEVNRLTESIASDFDQFARRKGLRFTKVMDPSLAGAVWADRQVVEKIVMNLLNNSFKYTPEGGEVSIETHASSAGVVRRFETCYTVGDEEAEGFAIAVRDNGVGISASSITTVFDRYYNVKTANLDAHLGTGIGLALVKSLVLLHKGKITICSERDKGTDMVIVLPGDKAVYGPEEFAGDESPERTDPGTIAARPDEGQTEAIQAGQAVEGLLRDRRRILVAEDNDDLRRLIADYLSPHYDVAEAGDGAEASLYVEEHEVNMVISDIMMPVKDGIAFCRELKSDVDTSHIPFIMLTAKTGLGAKLEGAESGADVYFEKPVDFNLLLLTVRNIFERQDKLRDHYSKNYFVDSAELAANEKDNAFLKKLVSIIEANLTEPVIDVHLIASGMSMSRTKLYSKLKSMTGRSIVEFILNYRLRRAAKLMIEEDISMKEVMERIGIRSQSYFTNVFKKEFGDTPAAFARKQNLSKKRKG